VNGEDLSEAQADLVLDKSVELRERAFEPPGEIPSDRTLAGTAQSNERNNWVPLVRLQRLMERHAEGSCELAQSEYRQIAPARLD
jgi:hypothetical protein